MTKNFATPMGQVYLVIFNRPNFNGTLMIVGNEPFLLSKVDEDEEGDELGFHLRTNEKYGKTVAIRCNKSNNPQKIENDPNDIRHYGILYSRAKSRFKTKPIKSSTTQQLDNGKYDIDDKEDFTDIKQLIIDIGNEDNQLWMDQTIKACAQRENPDFDWFNKKDSKLARFKNAFDGFFDTIKFSEVKTDVNEKNVYFTRCGKSLKIDDLSSGEKQIVFRGAQLLRNSGNLSGGVVLVDEPELSMHPKWQAKILKYYRDLFPKNEKQETQMIFATHSPGVICEAMEHLDDIKVIVLKCDDKGVVSSGDIETPLVLKGETSAEINYQAFNIASTDYHNALYGYIEAEGWKDDFNKAHPKVKYIKQNKDGTTATMNVTLSEKIRHIIHHPENGHNTYSDKDIKASIKAMREFIIGQQNIGVCKSGVVTN